MKRTVILFQNTRSVISAEKKCEANNIAIKLIPVPKNISSECGICIEVQNNLNEITELLTENKISCKISEF